MKNDVFHIFQSGHGDTSNGVVEMVEPAVQETAIVSGGGTAADLAGFRSCLIVIPVGAYVDGSSTITINESDSAATSFSAVANADLRGGDNAIAMNATATCGQMYVRGYVGNKRYLEVVIDQATTGHIIGAYALRGHKMNRGKLNESA